MATNNTEHILVIRLSAMGDVAMTVPVLLGLVKKYPNLRITILTKPFFATILSDIPNITIVFADVKGKHKGVIGLWKLYKQLSRLGISCVADLHNVLRSTILKQFFRFESVPFIQIDKGRAEKKSLIDPNRTKFEPLKTTLERYADVFTKLGYPITIQEMDILPKKSIPDCFDSSNGVESVKFLGIAPFAAFSGKMYPLDLMKKVIHELNNTKRYTIILFGGGKKEIEILSSWEKEFANVTNIAGKLKFSDELRLISNLSLMVAMDSGNAHLAAMFGVPTLTLWGVTHPFAGFYPFRQPVKNSLLSDREKYPMIPTSIYGNKFPPGYENVMKTIEPETVVEKVHELLDTSM